MRPRLLTALAGLLSAVAVVACGGSSKSSSSRSNPTAPLAASTSSSSTATTYPANGIGYEGIPLEQGPQIAPASTTLPGTTVDGVHCAPVEQLAYHIHAHLAVFVNGRLYQLPAGIGIPGSVAEDTNYGPVAAGGKCFYWLHTHTADGIIHIESPVDRVYTLGDFFDEWHQPLSATQVGGVHGRISAFFNGKPWKQSVRSIPLLPHALIQFNIGEPAPPLMPINWNGTGL
jgi:hypothetical protein